MTANGISLCRGLAAVCLGLLYFFGEPGYALVTCAVAMWATDVVDGWVARSVHPRGELAQRVGPLLDPLMDDMALFIGFSILLAESMVPWWFFGLLALGRIMFQTVRMAELSWSGRTLSSTSITKLSGVMLAAGQCFLLVEVNSSLDLSQLAESAVLVVMTATLTASMFWFLCVKNRSVLTELFNPSGR